MGEIVCSCASHRLAMFETMPVRDVSSRFVVTVDISCSNAQYTETAIQAKPMCSTKLLPFNVSKLDPLRAPK